MREHNPLNAIVNIIKMINTLQTYVLQTNAQ